MYGTAQVVAQVAAFGSWKRISEATASDRANLNVS
jgi:hypothetical protein